MEVLAKQIPRKRVFSDEGITRAKTTGQDLGSSKVVGAARSA